MLELLEREKDGEGLRAVLDSCPALVEALQVPTEDSNAEVRGSGLISHGLAWRSCFLGSRGLG